MKAKKILIVEDEVISGLDLAEKLTDLGYQPEPEIIRYAEDISTAVKENRPDLMLVDIRLKGRMDGVDAAARIKDLDIPVIFLTAFSDPGTLEKAKKIGPYAFLKKPVRTDELKIALEIGLYKAKMDQQQKEDELKFRTIADFAYDWETWVGPKGEFLHVSPSCERITGFRPERFMEEPGFIYQIVYPEDRKMVQDTFERHLSDMEEQGILEFRITARDGSEKWIEHVCRPVFTPEGTYLGRRAGNRDISDRKRLELELKRRSEQLQTALDEITKLQNLIPICSNCKKIRDDQGYWNVLESYIEKYFDVSFTHGLCPDCMETFYGSDDWYIERKKKRLLTMKKELDK